MVDLKRQSEWLQSHTLTKQDLRKMILEKLERATAYYKAQQKRETAKGNRRSHSVNIQETRSWLRT